MHNLATRRKSKNHLSVSYGLKVTKTLGQDILLDEGLGENQIYNTVRSE